jgi:hypothetical protein
VASRNRLGRDLGWSTRVGCERATDVASRAEVDDLVSVLWQPVTVSDAVVRAVNHKRHLPAPDISLLPVRPRWFRVRP